MRGKRGVPQFEDAVLTLPALLALETAAVTCADHPETAEEISNLLAAFGTAERLQAREREVARLKGRVEELEEVVRGKDERINALCG